MNTILSEADASSGPGATLGLVRGAVRDVLLSSTAFRELDAGQREELAGAMVKVCHTAAELIRDEMETAGSISPPRPAAPALSRAQSAGSSFSGVAADRVAGTTRNILNAVSFPRFVTELITGVFRAMADSSQQQMQSYVELLRNVAASTEGFADSAMSAGRARQWLAEQFPAAFEVVRDEDSDSESGQPAGSILQLKSGAAAPPEAALRAVLDIPPGDPVPSGNPEANLVPFARLALARQKQQMLATLVSMGMQRVVIESGRINASMRFHIDTRSAAQEDDAQRFSLENEISGSGSFGVGPWGASASVRNNIAYVSTQTTQTTEELNTDLELNSAVELVFKTDYLPLDRLAGREQSDRIRVNTLNPDAETRAANEARQSRERRYSEEESSRRGSMGSLLAPRPAPPPASAPSQPGAGAPASPARTPAPPASAAPQPAAGAPASPSRPATPPTSAPPQPGAGAPASPARTPAPPASAAPQPAARAPASAPGQSAARPPSTPPA